MKKSALQKHREKKKKQIQLISVKSEVSDLLSNEGRKIIINENNIDVLNSAIFLHHTLERFGDFTGEKSQAEITLNFKGSIPKVSVNQDCYYQGNYNYSSGKMKAETVALAIEMMFSNHFSEYLNNGNEIEKNLSFILKDNFVKLMREDTQALTEQEKSELYSFLD